MSRKFLVDDLGLVEVTESDILTEQQIVERLQAYKRMESQPQRIQKKWGIKF